MSTMLWRRLDGEGHDRCALEPDAEGHRLAGTALFVHAGVSYDIRYTVIADDTWRTRVVAAHVLGGRRERRLSLRADGSGSWWMGEAKLTDLAGCLDVDLAFTPATNTLPIRRLGLRVGEEATTDVARVGFPEDALTRVAQTYARVGDDRYRLEGEQAVEITVSDAGLVVGYPGGWEAVVAS